MSTSLRSESFHAVGEQIAITLHEANQALEAFADGGGAAEDLDRCSSALHAVRGALQLTEIYGAGLLAEEMESTCDYLKEGLAQSRPLTDEGVESLSRAMVQLPAYLDRIMNGGKDIPLVLLPLLNDLRAARGQPLLSESTLLLLNIASPVHFDSGNEAPASRTPSGEDINNLVVTLRPQFQLGLLGWIKDSSSKPSLRRMAGVAERLEKAAEAEEIHQLWWVVGGILEALLDGGLENSVALKRLIGQADREIKRLEKMGVNAYVAEPPLELVNNLLYYVARSSSRGERCSAIRKAFNLSDFSPADEQVEAVRESLSAPSPKLMKTVADAIREDLAKAKDVLDIYVRTGMQDVSDLEAQVGLLRKISDTLGVLGLGALREIVQQRSEELQQIVSSDGERSEARLVGLAAALLDVEERLDDSLLNGLQSGGEEAQPQVDRAFREVTEAVMRECIVNLAHIKESVTQVLMQPDDRAALDSLEDQLRGIGAGLTMLGKARSVRVLSRIGDSLRRCMQTDTIVRDPESINRLADAIVSLEYYMETLKAGRKDPDYMLDNAERSLDVLDGAIAVIVATGDSGEPSHTKTLQIDTAQLDQLQTDIEAPAEPDKTSVIDVPVLAGDMRQSDPELLEIFIEEAREEIAAIRRHFPVWAENQVDEEALITVRRAFHTLKGSGRMVGAARIGEFAWAIENLLNRIISKTIEAGPAIVSFLTDVVDAVPELLEQLEVGTEPTSDIARMAADAAGFAEGFVPDRYSQLPREARTEQADIDAAETAVLSEDETAALSEDEAVHQPEAEPAGIDPVLLDILQRETSGHLATVRNFIESNARDEPPYAVTEEMHRACHTLHGSVTMANATDAAVLTEPLYLMVERLYRSDTFMNSDQLRLCGLAADAIEATIGGLADPAQEIPDSSGVVSQFHREAEKYSATVDRQPDVEEEPAEEEGVQPSAHEQVTDAPGPEFDAEIAGIFAEEAAEILEEADAAISGLAANRSATAPLAELQRHLHTLKGGARMAGIATMGDFSHELESLLIRINQGGMGLDDEAFNLLQSSIDELHRMREQVLSGAVSPPAADLAARLASVAEATMMTPAAMRHEEAEEEIATDQLDELSAEAESSAEERITQQDAADSEVAEDDAATLDTEAEDEFPAKTPLVPEPTRLGELARELTSPAPPEHAAPSDASPSEVPVSLEPAAIRREMARVDSAMLENLLNNAGEISIFHSRLNQQMSSIQFNLVELGQTVHRLQQQLRLLEIETEAQILFRHKQESADDEEFDPLELDRYSTIQQLSRALAESASDVSSIKDLLQNVAADTETILMQQARTTSELQDSLLRTRMVPFDHHVPRLSRLVRQQSQESGKPVELIVEGSSGELDRQVMEKMLPPLEHMLRNAVIHGIEKPVVRQETGKPALASIRIRFRREGSQVLIDITDDGAGLDLQAIRKKAVSQGLIEPSEEISDEETIQLILRSGLSTANKLTQSAGRGIGMDVVVNEIAKLGGTLTIKSETGKGCTFTVRLPYTLAITQAFIVKVAGEVFALPLPTVEGIVRLSRAEFDRTLEMDSPIIEYGGRKYRLRHLGLFLGLGPAMIAAEDDQVAVILVEAGDNSTALIVDETADSREIVVKPIGTMLATIRGVAGATILGDGRIVVILDPGSLVRSAVKDTLEARPSVAQEEELPPLALVVDDSITMRRVTQRLLERNGMRVITAKDGMEGLEVLQDHRPDIVVLDIEMPRMDGYEFAGHIRNTPDLADLPIIMVTSRTGEKHRARAIEIGVNDYLGKPYQEHEMLEAIRHLLGDDFNKKDRSRTYDTVS